MKNRETLGGTPPGVVVCGDQRSYGAHWETVHLTVNAAQCKPRRKRRLFH
jgi:hypothetical protein